MNTGFVVAVVGIGAALALGAKRAAEAATGIPLEAAVPAGETLIPASAFPTTTLPPLAPIPSSPLISGASTPVISVPTPGATAPVTAVAPTAPVLSPTTAARVAAGPSGSMESGFMLSDKAMAKLGLAGVRQVTKWFLTPSDVPATALSPEVASAWQSYRFAEFADYSQWAGNQTPLTEIGDFSEIGNLEALESIEAVAGGIDSFGGLEAAGGAFPGELGGLESAAGTGAEAATVGTETISLLGPALQVLGVCAVLIDIGFTITGDQPVAMKAINVALDVAILVCMFIPVWGWIVALVLSIVKAIIGLFAGGGPSHAQREAEEMVWYVEHGAKPFIRLLADVRSPRELVDHMVAWTSGYCGGHNEVAIAFWLINADDPAQRVGIGSMHPGSDLPNECYWNDLGTYTNQSYYRGQNPYYMTRDDMAWALVNHGLTDLTVRIQAGISESMRGTLDATMDEIVTKKITAWREAMLDHGLDLDDMDAIAGEQRKQPRLEKIAAYFGFESWKGLTQWHLQDYWTRYIVTHREGSLFGFAVACGYETWTELRDAVMESYGWWYDYLTQMEADIAVGEALAALPTLAASLPATVPTYQWQDYGGP